MAQVVELKELENSEIEGGKVGYQVNFTIDVEDVKDNVFMQNVYLPKKTAEKEAQKYADQYESDYKADREAEKKAAEKADKSEDSEAPTE